MIRVAVVTLLAVSILRTCGTDEVSQRELIEQLQSRLSVGVSRREVESLLTEMGLRYTYVSRSELEAVGQATYESIQLSGHVQVKLPTEKGLLFETKGWVFIDFDTDERIINVRTQRGKAPR